MKKERIKKERTEQDFLQVIFASHAFWEYFHNLYLDLSKSCKADGIFFEHTWIILCIKKYEKISISDLVKISNKKQSTLSRAVAVLQKAGYIEKTRDKKMFILTLTKSGIELYEHLEKIYDYLNDLFKKHVDESKIHNLIKLFNEINQDLEINSNEYIGDLF